VSVQIHKRASATKLITSLAVAELLVFAVFSNAPAWSNPSDADEFHRLYRKNDFKNAAPLARKLIKAEPNNSHWKMGLVQCGLNGGCSLEETESTLRSLRSTKESPDTLLWFQQILEERRGNVKAALACSDKLAKSPDYGEQEVFKRYCYARTLQNDTLAIDALAAGRKYSGLIWLSSRGKKGTHAGFTESLKALNDNGMQGAVVLLLSKIPAKEQTADDLQMLANSWLGLKKPNSEIIRLEKNIIRLFPNDATSVLTAAKNLAGLDECEVSWNAIKSIEEKEQFNHDYWRLKSAVALKRHDFKTAEQAMNRAISLKADKFEYYVTRCSLRGILQMRRGVLDDMSTMIRLRPTDIQCRAGRADYYLKQKMYPEAIQDFTEIVRLTSGADQTKYLLLKAKSQDAAGDVRGALTTVATARKSNLLKDQVEALQESLQKEADAIGLKL
jgi:tetratricopeptide (TPR) repeat protein